MKWGCVLTWPVPHGSGPGLHWLGPEKVCLETVPIQFGNVSVPELDLSFSKKKVSLLEVVQIVVCFVVKSIFQRNLFRFVLLLYYFVSFLYFWGFHAIRTHVGIADLIFITEHRRDYKRAWLLKRINKALRVHFTSWRGWQKVFLFLFFSSRDWIAFYVYLIKDIRTHCFRASLLRS